MHLLESVEFKHRIKHIVEIIEEVNWQDIDPDMLTRFVGFLLLLAGFLLHVISMPPPSLQHMQCICVSPYRFIGQ